MEVSAYAVFRISKRLCQLIPYTLWSKFNCSALVARGYPRGLAFDFYIYGSVITMAFLYSPT